MPRIDDRYLKANHKPGDMITSEHMNEVESVVKAGINANYADIVNLSNNTVNDVLVNGESVVEVEDNVRKAKIDLSDYGDKNYVHSQTEASDTWVITHNLNKYPAVTVINSAGEEVVGEITHDSVNQITIKFSGAFKGTATLN